MVYADIEYSKKLKDLFPESEWWWSVTAYEEWHNLPGKVIHKNHKRKPYGVRRYYPAPTTDELLSILPSNLNIYKALNHYAVYYEKYKDPNSHDTSLPNALAKLLIYLQEKGIL